MFTSDKILWHLVFVAIAFLSVGISSCVSSSGEDEEAAALRSSYTLELGAVVKNQPPLPHYTPIWLNWYQGSVLQSRILKYQAWDVNHDGRIDYLVELSDRGQVVSETFDFDMDGQIDITKTR